MRLGEETCTIDVNTPEFPQDAIFAVEEAVADAIDANAPVIIHLCPPEKVTDFPLRKTPPQGEEVIRVVEIQDNDFSPCCGTHLASTGSIGILKILSAEKYKGMTRITFAAGRRALRDYRLLRQNGDLISRAVKAPISEIGKGVLALVDRVNHLERQVKEMEEAAAQIRAETLLRDIGALTGGDGEKAVPAPVYAVCIPDACMKDVLRIGRAAQKLSGAILVLGSETEGKFAAFCSAQNADIRPLLKDRLEAAGGRGGGGPSFFQGAFDSPEKLKTFLSDIRAAGF
jgi:alanyl-tRNA synthetase